jgi:dihydroorotase-like cyclic amidohydrolase
MINQIQHAPFATNKKNAAPRGAASGIGKVQAAFFLYLAFTAAALRFM